MKITFVMAGGFNLSGGDRVIATYAERLYKRGHDVHVVSAPLPQPRLREQLRSLAKGRGLIPRSKPGPSHFDGLSVPHRRLESSRPVNQYDLPDADVVIATWWETGEWVMALPPSKGAKAFFVQHYEAFDYVPKHRVDAVWRMPLHKIVISRWLADIAREQFGDSDVSLVRNSVETALFCAPERARNKAPVIGMLYSSTPWKGCALSLRALSCVRQEFPDLRVITFGSSDREIHPSVPLPAWASFEFCPKPQRIVDIYSSCDVWLCGSSSEGFHLPLLESMACRAPAVSTAVGAAPELIENGVNGYCVSVGNVDALSGALLSVLRQPAEQWRAMSDRALETARRYTWDEATDLFERSLAYAMEKQGHGKTRAAAVREAAIA